MDVRVGDKLIMKKNHPCTIAWTMKSHLWA